MTTSATAPFDYFKPSSVEEASRLLSRFRGAAKLIAGGHSLVPLMKTRLVSPEALIDLSGIKDLVGIKSSSDGLSIGAMTTYDQIESSEEVKTVACTCRGSRPSRRRPSEKLGHNWRFPSSFGSGWGLTSRHPGA